MILYDEPISWKNLLPLTFTRSVAECRIGILTIQEKWNLYLNISTEIKYCEDYLKNGELNKDHLSVVSNLLPNPELVLFIKNLEANSNVYYHEKLIISYGEADNPKKIDYTGSLSFLNYPWDIFKLNDQELRSDFTLLTKNRTSLPISNDNKIIGNDIFLEEGAKVSCAIINTHTGPVYIGRNAEIMEGAIIRGPFALGENAQVKMGAKIYGATTFGPGCKVGGEVTNSVLFANTNKAHDGYLGNSVLGEWCNLGADTNSSNLKNNYSPVEVFNYLENKSIESGELFCGLIMGDHSKAGINTMFNTGTVVGVSANIVGSGFPNKHIPSFSWSISEKIRAYDIEKCLETSRIVYRRRGKDLSTREELILRHISSQSK